MSRHRATRAPEPGGLLVRAGAVVFLVGFVAICLDVLPHPLSRQERPLPLNLLAFLTSLGLAMAIWGGWRAIRAGMRRAADEAATAGPAPTTATASTTTTSTDRPQR